jgi:dephospho-CoA kinase
VPSSGQLTNRTPSGTYAPGVRRVLLTGMSGTGKSSVIRALRDRGYKAVDTDEGWSEPLPDGRQRWREDAIQALLATEDTDVLFVAGCEENQAKFHAQFDHIVLLSAPLDTLLERLATRTTNPYGKTPEELRRFLDDVETIEPLLRRVASHEISTTMPLNDVVSRLLEAIGAAHRGGASTS